MERYVEEVMSSEVRNDYIQEYMALTCKNLSLQEFIEKRHKKDASDRREIARLTTILPIGLKAMNNAEINKTPPEGMLPRTIIIDGANVMHGGSPYLDSRAERSGAKIPDVAALLSVIRYFIVRGFEVITVISRKYAMKDGTNYKTAIDELVKNHMCVIVPNTNLDDTICLDFAAQLNGIVVTADKYRDHANESDRYRRLVTYNRLHIDWVEVKRQFQNQITQKHGDFVAGKRFEFRHDNDREMTTEEVRQRLYVRDDTSQYEITKEGIELMKTGKKSISLLALVSSLITDGISICKENALAILQTPIHKPSTSSNIVAYTAENDPNRSQIAAYEEDSAQDW